jgi:hypothetical protein
MPCVESISVEERRRRLAVRHHLAAPVATPEHVSADLVGLHSSDPATVFLSCWARVSPFAPEDLEAALYERRDLLRLLGMRRTMFVVTHDLAEVMDAACTKAFAPAERKRLVGLIEAQELAKDGERWLRKLEGATLAALSARGEATATELTEDVPQLGLKLEFGKGTSWAGTVGMSTRLLFLLAAQGDIIRGRPLGTWRSTQYRWALTRGWITGGFSALEEEAARVELLRRWLGTYGPGTLTDLKWWTGWTVRAMRGALAGLEVTEVDLDGETGYALSGDLAETDQPEPWVALLAGLDPALMGWKQREWFLGGHEGPLFDRNGNGGPTIWAGGRIVGGWTQLRDGTIATRLLEEVGSEAGAAVDAKAEQLGEWLGDARFTTRFPAPLEKELAAQ